MIKRSLILTLAILFVSKWTLSMFLLHTEAKEDFHALAQLKKEISSHVQIDNACLLCENEPTEEETEEGGETSLGVPVYFHFFLSSISCKEAYYFASFGHIKTVRIFLRNCTFRN